MQIGTHRCENRKNPDKYNKILHIVCERIIRKVQMDFNSQRQRKKQQTYMFCFIATM